MYDGLFVCLYILTANATSDDFAGTAPADTVLYVAGAVPKIPAKPYRMELQ